MISVNNIENAKSPLAQYWYQLFEIIKFRAGLGSDIDDEIVIEIVQSNNWRCETLPDLKLIIIDSIVIETLWALSYSQFVFYKKYIERATPGQYIHFVTNQYERVESKLFQWSIDTILGCETEHQFSDLYTMVDSEEIGTIANHLLVDSFSFFCLHELSHIGVPNGDSISVEVFCDQNAAKLIMDGKIETCETLNSKVKSGIGVACGLLVILLKGLMSSDYDGIDHPKDYDRIIYVLQEHFSQDCDYVWGFVVGMISLQFSRAGLDVPNGEFDNFFECTKAFNSQLKLLDSE